MCIRDRVQCCIDLAMGNKTDIEAKINEGAAIRYFDCNEGKIVDVKGVEDAQNQLGVIQVSFVKGIGDIIQPINSSSDRIGFVIAVGENTATAISICEKAIEKIKIFVE